MAIDFDTIAAISTPPGEGGIGIVRLSGDEALDIAKNGKSDNDTIIEKFVLIYQKTQQNCCDTITEVLNKILND